MRSDCPLQALAEDLMTRHRLAHEAVSEMVAAVMEDDELRDAVFLELFEGACLRYLQGAASSRYSREKRLSGPGGTAVQSRSSDIGHWAGAVANSLLNDFILPNGIVFGDATRADLDLAMAAYQTAAQDAGIKHRWVRLVHQGLTEGRRVRDAYTDERLAELRAEARKIEA